MVRLLGSSACAFVAKGCVARFTAYKLRSKTRAAKFAVSDKGTLITLASSICFQIAGL